MNDPMWRVLSSERLEEVYLIKRDDGRDYMVAQMTVSAKLSYVDALGLARQMAAALNRGWVEFTPEQLIAVSMGVA